MLGSKNVAIFLFSSLLTTKLVSRAQTQEKTFRTFWITPTQNMFGYPSGEEKITAA